jgi:uncharacterized protein YegL
LKDLPIVSIDKIKFKEETTDKREMAIFILDNSGSMQNTYTKQNGHLEFNELLKEYRSARPKATIKFIEFGSKVHEVKTFDENRIEDGYFCTWPCNKGKTALRDAISSGIDHCILWRDMHQTMTLFVVTDGDDNESKITAKQLCEKYKQCKNLQLTIVAPGENEKEIVSAIFAEPEVDSVKAFAFQGKFVPGTKAFYEARALMTV